MEWIEDVIHWLVDLVHTMGYLGIFVMTFVESTFMPVPSEATMIPAGYLIHEGKMAFIPVLISSVLGTVGGAYFNFWLARRFGRGLFIRYGKYLFMTPSKLAKLEKFFADHGAISTFTGRLIPGIRHYISFPAGLANMNLKKFLGYTALGGFLWMNVLIWLGYFIGRNEGMAKHYMPLIKLGIVAFVTLIVIVYVKRQANRKKAQLPAEGDTVGSEARDISERH